MHNYEHKRTLVLWYLSMKHDCGYFVKSAAISSLFYTVYAAIAEQYYDCVCVCVCVCVNIVVWLNCKIRMFVCETSLIWNLRARKFAWRLWTHDLDSSRVLVYTTLFTPDRQYINIYNYFLAEILVNVRGKSYVKLSVSIFQTGVMGC